MESFKHQDLPHECFIPEIAFILVILVARRRHAKRCIALSAGHRLLNDDRADHARMDRTREVISAGLVELVREALVRIHAA
jgi:hypothetical protein